MALNCSERNETNNMFVRESAEPNCASLNCAARGNLWLQKCEIGTFGAGIFCEIGRGGLV